MQRSQQVRGARRRRLGRSVECLEEPRGCSARMELHGGQRTPRNAVWQHVHFQDLSAKDMTLKHVRPATMNSAKLFALVLFAIGSAIFAYVVAAQGRLRRPPIASTIAWTGGFVSLSVDGRKRPAGEAPRRRPAPPGISPKTPAQSHLLSTNWGNLRKSPRSADDRHASSAPEYTHQTSHF